MLAGSNMFRCDHLVYERHGDVAYVTIDSHDLQDAADASLRVEIRLAFTALRDDEEVRAVVLTGIGDGSSVQPDLQQPSDPRALPARGTKGPMRTLVGLIKSIGKPVVLAIDGVSPSYGCEIAMACTCRIATDTARFDLSEMEEWPIRHETLSAYDAHGIGLVDEIVPPMELLEHAGAIAREIAASPATAAHYANETARRCLGLRLAMTGPVRLSAERRAPHLANR
ncbi:enoyl-CoA hydratase/isomerase family protein [Sphingomonas sp. JC676]|uniref:enoyl-CoA hydratase/isomerase family protein n=1 Tax=Sphingomonas sp. JC676 TaxID=2768065 RepID=UPI001657D3AD|nr:enoyl-CoA hydratase/isomerase family protein [Sphingomonas sp. JC676]MBC9031282.1 enoyl-CoA hydratase/isomerase family protein [Sphingomonas sp. JC676]